MFKKKTYIRIDFEEYSTPYVTVSLNKKSDGRAIASFINNLILRNNLHAFMDIIINESIARKVPHIGEEICDHIDEVQSNITIRQDSGRKRNPLVKPTEVMEQFGESDE